MKTLFDQYLTILRNFFDDDAEEALYQVSEFGKELMQMKKGPDILLDFHSRALKKILHGLDPMEVGKKVMDANDLLLEGIMGYAMSFYNTVYLLEKKQRDLEKANEELKSLDKLKSMFIGCMSHELRTPLNSIIGFTGILLMGMAGDLNEEQRYQLNLVKDNAEHLLRLINDILDITKIEADKIELVMEEFELTSLLNSVYKELKQFADKKHIAFDIIVPEHLFIVSDKLRIKQIVTNLVNNAIKFTEKGSVLLKCETKSDQIVISIEDTGRGIPPDKLDFLFQPFSKISSGTEGSNEGTGLGLYISKKLAKRLGGDIEVVSEFKKGSKFSLILPQRIEG